MIAFPPINDEWSPYLAVKALGTKALIQSLQKLHICNLPSYDGWGESISDCLGENAALLSTRSGIESSVV